MEIKYLCSYAQYDKRKGEKIPTLKRIYKNYYKNRNMKGGTHLLVLPISLMTKGTSPNMKTIWTRKTANW